MAPYQHHHRTKAEICCTHNSLPMQEPNSNHKKSISLVIVIMHMKREHLVYNLQEKNCLPLLPDNRCLMRKWFHWAGNLHHWVQILTALNKCIIYWWRQWALLGNENWLVCQGQSRDEQLAKQQQVHSISSVQTSSRVSHMRYFRVSGSVKSHAFVPFTLWFRYFLDTFLQLAHKYKHF